MNHYGKKNIVFILFFLVSFIVFGVISYNIDPYSVFKKDISSVDLTSLPHRMVYPFFRLHRDNQCDVLILGTSDSINILGHKNTSKIHSLYSDYPFNLPHLLEAYLDIHSEIKQVILSFSVVYPFQLDDNFFPQYKKNKSHNFSISDLHNLLFSQSVLVRTFRSLLTEQREEPQSEGFVTKPYFFILESKLENPFFSNEKYFGIVNKIFEIVKSKNVKYTVVIPPVNAVYWGYLYQNNKKIIQMINDMKRMLVSQADYVYDFSLITKSSSISVFSDKNFFWHDFCHFSSDYGEKYKNLILDINPIENVEYHKLTMDNIEEKLKIQEKLIVEYVKNNSSIINTYTGIANDNLKNIDENQVIINKNSR